MCIKPELTMNKDNNSLELKNRAITPDEALSALDSLPHDFVQQTKIKLEGQGKRVYSDSYISKVKNGDVFNEDIFDALVEVGNDNVASQQKKEMFKKLNKKSPAA